MQYFRGQKALKITIQRRFLSRPSLDIVSFLKKLSKTQAESFCLLKSLMS